MYPSVVLQAVVDVQYVFRDTYANTPGSAHDAAVFRRSPLSTRILREMPKRDKLIDGVNVPLHILGDPAYPMLYEIVKGYTGTGLSPEHDSFNVYHSKARMCVEIAFGRLKARWRMLRKRIDIDYHMVPKLITTCCMLHNFVELNKQTLPPHLLRRLDDEPEGREQPPLTYNNEMDSDAATYREAIKNFLKDTQPLLRPFHL